MVDSVDTDETVPLGGAWSESTLFPRACLPEN